MLPVSDLQLGYTDAENYKRRENKELFNRVFIRNDNVDKLCEPSISFLIGEKGAGKTAYALYLANNHYKNNFASIRYIRETDYLKFIALKTERHLTISDYSSIWRVILYLLLSQQVVEREGSSFLNRFVKMKALKAAVEEYYQGAFAPEMTQALQFVAESNYAAQLMAKHLAGSVSEKDTQTFSATRFQANLYYIQRAFEQAFEQQRLEYNHILFIDGIDIRPGNVPFADYIECIRGLANAVWEMNNDRFPPLKGKGRLRVVLLIRPDIFASLGLQNLNTKMRENSVFLDWRTDYANYRSSQLFRVVDHLLASQQQRPLAEGEAWDHYFPWNAPDVEQQYQAPTSFLSFLRYSYYRPRDIITALKILQELSKEEGKSVKYFGFDTFSNPSFRRRYADYLLGEIRDHLAFYYSKDEYEVFLKFFTFLKGKAKLTYEEYLDSYMRFSQSSAKAGAKMPDFMLSAGNFLQFLYDLNIVCYMEKTESDKVYIRWCFRERSYGNIAPKVKEDVTYQVFIGLFKALNIGQALLSSDR